MSPSKLFALSLLFLLVAPLNLFSFAGNGSIHCDDGACSAVSCPAGSEKGSSDTFHRNNRNDTDEVLQKVDAANDHRDELSTRLSVMENDPSQFCGGNLAFQNHSADYTLDSGLTENISYKKIFINGSLDVDSGTGASFENCTIYFNFGGSDPFIRITGSSSLSLANVSIESDVPVRIYTMGSRLDLNNTYIDRVRGDDIVLGTLDIDHSFISSLEDTLTMDRSTVNIRNSHINGTDTGSVYAVGTILNVTGCAVSNLGTGLTVHSSTCSIRETFFYSNGEGVSSVFVLGSEIHLDNSTFLDNGDDLLINDHSTTVRNCLFSTSGGKTIGYSGDGSHSALGQSPAPPYDTAAEPMCILENNVFHNISSISFQATTFRTSGNIFHGFSTGYDIYNCAATMNNDTLYNVIRGTEMNNARESEITLNATSFTNWYRPFVMTGTSLSMDGCHFRGCDKGLVLNNSDELTYSRVSRTAFYNCTTAMAFICVGATTWLDNASIVDCDHAIDLYSSDLDIYDSTIDTLGWNLKLEHGSINTVNVHFDENRIEFVEDCSLLRHARMRIMVMDYMDVPLEAVKIDADEILYRKRYSFRTDPTGLMDIIILNVTLEEQARYPYEQYVFTHESAQWGNMREVVDIVNGESITLRIGYSDPSIAGHSSSHDDPYHGMEMTNTVTIRNNDHKAAEDVSITFYIDFEVKEEKVIPSIEYNETIDLNFTWIALKGSRFLEVSVDPFNSIFESNESNNYLSLSVHVIDKPSTPVASLSISQDEILVGETVILNASASKAGTSEIEYRFDFGDGETSEWLAFHTTNHSYNRSGTYFLSCRIRDAYGHTSQNSSERKLRVRDPPPPPKRPVAMISLPPFIDTITVKTMVSFSPASSYSPDERDIVKFGWTFSDGMTNETTTPTTISHRFNDDSLYRITLVVEDDRGIESEPVHRDIEVNNLPPNAVAAGNRTEVSEGGNVSFTSRGTTDPDDDVVLDLDYTWYFPGDVSISGRQVTFQFNESGNHTVRLVVSDDDGMSDNRSVIVKVKKRSDVAITGKEERKSSIIERYWVWIISVITVLLIAMMLLINAKRQKKKMKHSNLRVEQELLEDEIRKKEITRSYEEAERQIRARIASGDKIDFTATEEEVPIHDADVDYYGLDNVVDYTGDFGIESAGDVVCHDNAEEENIFTRSENNTDWEAEDGGGDWAGTEEDGGWDEYERSRRESEPHEEYEEYEDTDEYEEYGDYEDEDEDEGDHGGEEDCRDEGEYRDEADYGDDEDYHGEAGYGDEKDYRDEVDYRDEADYGDDENFEDETSSDVRTGKNSYGRRRYEADQDGDIEEEEDQWEDDDGGFLLYDDGPYSDSGVETGGNDDEGSIRNVENDAVVFKRKNVEDEEDEGWSWTE